MQPEATSKSSSIPRRAQEEGYISTGSEKVLIPLDSPYKYIRLLNTDWMHIGNIPSNILTPFPALQSPKDTPRCKRNKGHFPSSIWFSSFLSVILNLKKKIKWAFP